MGLPLFILIKMKNLTIVINTEIGARYVMMPSEFLVSIAQANEVIFVCFHEIGTGKLLHTIFLFVEEDEENHIRGFSNYSKKGQKQILDDMRDFIIEDINNLLSETMTARMIHTQSYIALISTTRSLRSVGIRSTI